MRRNTRADTTPPPSGRRKPLVRTPAIVLTRVERGRQVVAEACGVARTAGITTGMDVAHARALMPADGARGGLHVEPHNPQRDAAMLRVMARWAIRFTPSVASDPPDGLLLDIAGCQRLYGGERPLLQQVTDAMMSLGFTVRAAIAPTVGGAWAIARFGADHPIIDTPQQLRDTLADLPVTALRIDTPTARALAEVAIERIGDLCDLPRRALGTRFGHDLLLRLDQALGRAFEPIDTVRPHDPVRVTRGFDGPVTNLEGVMLTVRQLIDALHTELVRREAGARRIDLTLDRIDAEPITRPVTLSHASRDTAHLWALLRPVTERVHLGHGVERITLAAPYTTRVGHPQSQINSAATNASAPPPDQQIGRLIDHMTNRLGNQRIRRVTPVPTHVPESAFISQPAARHDRPHHCHDAGQDARIVDADRPSRVYRRPHPVRVMLMAPDGPVVSLQRSDHGTDVERIVTSIGPERITTPWWNTADNVVPVTRDYYKLQDEAGRWWWAFREIETGRWFIHGHWS